MYSLPTESDSQPVKINFTPTEINVESTNDIMNQPSTERTPLPPTEKQLTDLNHQLNELSLQPTEVDLLVPPEIIVQHNDLSLQAKATEENLLIPTMIQARQPTSTDEQNYSENMTPQKTYASKPASMQSRHLDTLNTDYERKSYRIMEDRCDSIITDRTDNDKSERLSQAVIECAHTETVKLD
jgi:hypothetical protein